MGTLHIVYCPEDEMKNRKTVIYSPGYTDKEVFIEVEQGIGRLPYKNNTYLAEFFTKKGYAFVCVQHDLFDDNDGLEAIDPKAAQSIARKHLWDRGMINLLFVIEELKKQNLDLNLEKFIIGGHSNGGDISKYFANHNSKLVSHVIVCDGRRCPIAVDVNLKILMFEADDTSTDRDVVPQEGTKDNSNRVNLEWVIIKPKNSVHVGYSDDGSQGQRDVVVKAIDWFLTNF